MSGFFDMPAELRNVVYGQLLGGRDSRQQVHKNFGLFTVSKQVHDESTSYFYQHNAMDIDVPSPATRTATILPPIADKHVRYLRWLSVYVKTAEAHSSRQQKVASTIASLAVIGAKFEHVYICLQSSLSKLVNSRVDDSVFGMDHPITVALRQLLESGVAKIVSLGMCDTWFRPDVGQKLQAQYGTRLEFVSSSERMVDPRTLERRLTGSYVSTHLTGLGLDDEAIADARCPPIPFGSSTSSTPSSLIGCVASAFADLDTFSVTASGLGQDELADEHDADETCAGEEELFFSMEDVEEWEASTREHGPGECNDSQDMDLDDDDNEDEEMVEIPGEEIDAIMANMEEAAHYSVNDADMSFMVNFAPALLLHRHKLGDHV